MAQYICFFNGTATPDLPPNEWNEEGPIIGPLRVSFTFGAIKLHAAAPHGEDWGDFIPLKMSWGRDTCVIGDMHYADFEVWDEADPILASNPRPPVMSLEEYALRNGIDNTKMIVF